MSQKFQLEVEDAFKSSRGCLLATVPLKSRQLPIVEKLKKNPCCKLYTVRVIITTQKPVYPINDFQVTRGNRDTLIDEIIIYISV